MAPRGPEGWFVTTVEGLVGRFFAERIENRELASRARLLVALSLALVSLMPVFAVVAWVLYGLPVVAASALVCALALVACPIVLRVTGSLPLATAMLCLAGEVAILVVAGQVEGLTSPVLAYLAILPLLASLLAGRRWGLVWGALAMVGVVLLVALNAKGVLPNAELNAPLRRAAGASNAGVLITLALTLAIVYETLRQRTEAELKRTRDELIHSRERALIADRLASLGMLAAGVAHGINNPLAALSSDVQHTHARLVELAGQPGASAELHSCADVLSEALQSSRQIGDIILDLMTYAVPGSQTRGPVELSNVVRSALRLVAHEAKMRATVTTRLAPVTVDSSEQMLVQVLVNLLTNALQAFPERPVPENLLTVTTRDSSEEAVMEVADNGVGMTPEVRRRLFEPLFTTKPPGTGTGLGLWISQQLVTSLGGRIEVESSSGAGACFRVVLPRVA
jgi:C4-dicarboxylate-specific signal transduction histidine kinase